jgi:N-acetylglucosaminyldiphosphoundecaprenol N-acetyl-beta-D-mannosaminyltransferase
MDQEKIENVNYSGVKIDLVDYRRVYSVINSCLSNNMKGYICVNDVGNIIAATQDRLLFGAINSSLLNLADGMPLVWFAKLAGGKGIERITGLDIMINLLREKNSYSHYLLGDTDERISRVITKAKKINSDLNIKGYSPPFKEFDDEDNRLIFEKLNNDKPDIIWVSFGGGKQEKWMYENISRLDRGIMIGVGAAFKWFIGDLMVPPKIFQHLSLQWLFRFSQDMLVKETRDTERAKRALHQRWKFALTFPGEVLRMREKTGK